MGKLVLTINTDGEAFNAYYAEDQVWKRKQEIRRVMDRGLDVFDNLPDPSAFKVALRDSNGNTCGTIEWEDL